jgi:protein gp37
MGKNSHIEWTHHTFNPWWGCTKVSPACDNCYAESWAKRVGEDVWGKDSKRRFFRDSHWREPLKWHAEAVASGERARVFCASMADVFEDRRDLDATRTRLWDLIAETPMLDWLLLTKRPQAVKRLSPWGNDWPDNVWLGTTVEKQKFAKLRLPHLIANPAKVRFLSCEPLLGPIDLSPWLPKVGPSPINWIIAGGESGSRSRPMHPDWARGLRDTCDAQDIAFHFKQWGHWVPAEMVREHEKRVQMFELPDSKPVSMLPMGKKDAGRMLDGAVHDGVPSIAA